MLAGVKPSDSGPIRFQPGGQVGGQLDMRILGLHPLDQLRRVDQLGLLTPPRGAKANELSSHSGLRACRERRLL
jgi:hypothetical protein